MLTKCKIRVAKEKSVTEPDVWLGWDWQCSTCNDGAIFWSVSFRETLTRALAHLRMRELRELGLIDEMYQLQDTVKEVRTSSW